MKITASVWTKFARCIIALLVTFCLVGCGKKTTSSPGGSVGLQIVCSSIADRATDSFPAEISDLFSPISAGDTEYYPVIQLQRIDLDPLPGALTPALDENFSGGLEKTLGTWNRTKELRALRTQLRSQPVSEAFSKGAKGQPRPWDQALETALSHTDPNAVFVLQPGASDPAAGYAFQGKTFPLFVDTNAFREHLSKILAARPNGGGNLKYVLIFLSGANQPTPSPTPTPIPTQAPATPVPTAPPAARRAAAVLRFKGSNTIGAKLIGGLVDGFLAQEGWQNVTRVAGADADDYSYEGIVPGVSGVQSVTVSAHGSATAFDGLAKSDCDIGMASRRIKPAEEAALTAIGDMTSASCEHVLALDGLAIIVNKANPIIGLSRQQLQAIFSGQITDWSRVGGRPGLIHLYARDEKSGTYDTFKTLVLESATLAPTFKPRFDDSALLSDTVATDPVGIGFIGLPFVRSARALAISDAGAAPLLPTTFTVATEDYPLARRLFLYTPASPTNPLTLRFVEYALSSSGQEIVGKYGFIDQTIKKTKSDRTGDQPVAAAGPDLPPEYVRLTAGAERLAVNFRFRTNSSQLDNKAIDDLDRVVAYLASPAMRGKSVLLLGFADNHGPERINQTLSDERAKIVARQFGSRGVLAGVSRGFGSAVPVADNSADDGREKNRRVEVWMR